MKNNKNITFFITWPGNRAEIRPDAGWSNGKSSVKYRALFHYVKSVYLRDSDPVFFVYTIFSPQHGQRRLDGSRPSTASIRVVASSMVQRHFCTSCPISHTCAKTAYSGSILSMAFWMFRPTDRWKMKKSGLCATSSCS